MISLELFVVILPARNIIHTHEKSFPPSRRSSEKIYLIRGALCDRSNLVELGFVLCYPHPMLIFCVSSHPLEW